MRLPLIRYFFSVSFVACCAITAPGCQQSGGSSSATPKVGSISQQAGYSAVRSSSRSFSYLVAPGGVISIYDTTAGKLLLRTQVPPQTVIKVDVKDGIFTNRTKVVEGPLNEKNTRELRLDR